MARFSKLETINAIDRIGLIPVFYNGDLGVAKKIVKACAEGGAVCIEMTNRGDHAIEVFIDLEKYCKESLPKVILGTGSIVDAPTAANYIGHGANFIVGPVLDRETAILCNKRKIPYSPGCGSATEIQNAHALGVDYVKVFPGDLVGGPAFVKAVLGPCPWTRIMPTGGVDITEESLKEWFAAGVACVGIGSKLITKKIIKDDDYKTLSENVDKVISLIRRIKQ
ncbi:MAG: bifunctional 4-hydroxy-2-oxoglutarate aldolase/2-dehydro-3-deoxy-phosphogluconate aldolase [Candidatus Humimicrobiaceae bacterium]